MFSEQDVRLSIRAASSAFDAILLDVDNGPNGACNYRRTTLYTVWKDSAERA